LSKAHEPAKQVFTQHPAEPVVASTYAYSLHLQGRTREGLAVLEKLKTNALETPSVALYYGVLLSADGNTNRASKYLGIAQQSDFLPEEKALAAEAIKRLPSGG
jgi:Flp pilus assembly protein TadD